MLFKTLSWAIALLLPAKGDSKIYFINELIANIYMFIFNVLGYYLWGLTGLGIAFLVGYLFYLIQMIIASKWLYAFKFDMDLIKIFLIQFVLVCFCFCIQIFFTNYIAYVLGIIFILSSSIYSYNELDKRISLSKILRSKLFK
jgi:O-antigen/teichoic acid export membrane protein